MGIQHANFARSTLAVGLTSGDTTLSVVGTHGARFPTLGVGDFFYVVLENAVLQREILKVTARAGDTMTVVRGQDGTTAQAWVAGDLIEQRFVRAAISDSLGNSVQRTSATGAAITPAGTTAQRDVTPAFGYQRANSTTGQMEWWNGTSWAALSSVDLLNTTRVDVASAATVDLTANAPNTRNINITGTNTITGFTVASGQVYFVRFNAALTLTNNAAIVTQKGANITTAAGDTCIIRATAENIVEVMSYAPATFASGQVIQVQTYQDTGGTSTSTGSYSNVTASFKNFTPRSSNSKLIVECFFNMNVTIVAAANTFAYAVLYNNTAGSTFGTNPTFNVSNSSGGNALFTSGVCAGVVTNTALTTLQFALRAQVSNTGQSAIVTDHFWKITEVQN